MNFAQQHDIGAYLGVAPGAPSTATTAGAEAAVNGKVFDRQSSPSIQSVMIVASLQATLASGNSVAVALKLQDSPNNSDWTDYGTASGDIQTHDAAGGALSNIANSAKHSVDLKTADRYIRMVATPNFSATGTDTGILYGFLVFGGADTIPVATPTAI